MNKHLEWCPPGHGDLYTALYGSGALTELLAEGVKYMFVSNSDNLGATLDIGERRFLFLTLMFSHLSLSLFLFSLYLSLYLSLSLSVSLTLFLSLCHFLFHTLSLSLSLCLSDTVTLFSVPFSLSLPVRNIYPFISLRFTSSTSLPFIHPIPFHSTSSPDLLTYFASQDVPFLMECCRRTEADKKGGHLAVRASDGQLILRESAQCAKEDEAAFQNVNTHQYFNTNNLWVRLDLLKALMESKGGFVPLPTLLNGKTVDPQQVEYFT